MKPQNLPFVEQYRPKTLDGIMSHLETIKILKCFIEQKNMPHLLFYGPPGTGKTSTVEALVTELYGKDNVMYMTMNINASEERGIEIVRNKIKNFVSTAPLNGYHKDIPKYKFVILDEADAMTFDAQGMLKQVIEYYTDNARFCLICNCIKKINTAIQSRCTIFNFPQLNYDSVNKKIKQVANERELIITDDGIETIWKLSNGDMRKVLHMLQVVSINNKNIDAYTVTKFKNYPNNEEINKLFDVLRQGDLNRSSKIMNSIVLKNQYSLSNIITELCYKITDGIINGSIESDKGANILLGLRDIEMNIIVTSDTDIQMLNIASVFVD